MPIVERGWLDMVELDPHLVPFGELSNIDRCPVLLTGTCQEFKHAELFPYTELSPSERKTHWQWKQRRIKDYSSLRL